MNRHPSAWSRLVAATRSVEEPSGAVPYGFATRVAGLGLAAPATPPWGLFEKLALRGLLAAGAFCLAALALGYSSWAGDRSDDTVASADAISEILEVS